MISSVSVTLGQQDTVQYNIHSISYEVAWAKMFAMV